MVDLTKAVLVSDYNAYKNDSIVHTGSITLPTTLTAGQNSLTTVTVSLDIAPNFSQFFAYFTEYLDLTTYPNGVYGDPHWYPVDAASSGACGVWVTAPAGNVGSPLTVNINPVIVGTTIQVQAVIFNPYSNSVTLAPLTVPFAFTQYSLIS
jgi:hypothetical protein